jgi:TM2 domain-containing membrane protein YozV
MEQIKIEMFIASMSNKFPPEKLMMMRSQLEKLDDNKLMILQSINYKDPTTMIIVSILIGHLGIDRFMLGETGLGVAKLLTCGGLGIWTIVDWFTVMGRTRELNYQKFLQVAF